jgi:hypothetical protein
VIFDVVPYLLVALSACFLITQVWVPLILQCSFVVLGSALDTD